MQSNRPHWKTDHIEYRGYNGREHMPRARGSGKVEEPYIGLLSKDKLIY